MRAALFIHSLFRFRSYFSPLTLSFGSFRFPCLVIHLLVFVRTANPASLRKAMIFGKLEALLYISQVVDSQDLIIAI